uniref:DNA topoisomerase n=1 Tax=Ciona savignyi TaxID=51511 RepID=H2Z236_CIOSA
KMPCQASVFKVLNVAEKNDAAKRISDILSGHQYQVRNGLSRFNKIYEFNYYMLGQNCSISFTSLSGHLLNYDFTGIYRKWYSCHPLSLFDVAVEKNVTENMVDIKRTLEREVRNSQALVIWTDCDREGENIGFEIINICRNIKSNIPVYRARFSEITDRSIKSACNNLQQPDQRVSDAVDVRQELDLRIVVHTITQNEADGPITSTFSWKRNRLFNELACQVLYANCETPVVATVTNVSSRPRSRWRPLAMDTVELEKLASRKLRINAKETMKIAESLYTQGYISYPRTETNSFPKDFNLERLVQEQTSHPDWGGFASRLLGLNGGPQPRNGHKSDQAHPPIHPTKAAPHLTGNNARIYELITRHFLACCHRDAKGQETSVEIEVGGESFSVQGLMIIERNYLEVYHYDRWNGKIIAVYEIGDQFEPTDVRMTSGRTTAPLLTEADLISLMDKHGIGLFLFPTLCTDATHAEHIETIKQRMYVGLTNDQRFLPGELGMGLVEGGIRFIARQAKKPLASLVLLDSLIGKRYDLMGYAMSRPELRAELEADLRRICDGTANKNDVLQRHISTYRSVFQEAIQKADKWVWVFLQIEINFHFESHRLDEALSAYFGDATRVEGSNLLNPSGASPPVRPCPRCGKDMILKKKRDGGLTSPHSFMLSCTGYPNCRNALFLPSSVLDITVDSSVCPNCQPSPVHQVNVKLNPRSIPAYFSSDQIICIGGCDDDVTNVLGLRGVGGRGVGRGGGVGGRGERGRRERTWRARPGTAAPRGGTREKRKMPTPAHPHPHSNENTPMCNCSEMAVVLTVRREGPNTGRQFYKCSKQSGGCDFFLWADDRQSPLSTENTNPKKPCVIIFRPQQNAGSGDRMCKCNIQAVQRTVQKDGPNKGRVFYTCDKPRAEQCGFFEWEDAVPGSLVFGRHNTTPSYRLAQPSQYNTQQPNQPRPAGRSRKAPTCGLCREVGHTRRSCPNR